MRNNKTKIWLVSLAVLFTLVVTSRTPISQAADTKKISQQIPEATLPCSPEVKSWWDEIRAAGDAVMRSRGSKKERKRFAELLQDGAAKNYAPPIADHKPIPLYRAQPRFTDEARQNRVNANIGMQVEVKADGTIGEVTLLNRLGYGLDESAVSAVRNAVFLPAVKDGAFVNYTVKVEMSFSVR